jgi:hypothetical protein
MLIEKMNYKKPANVEKLLIVYSTKIKKRYLLSYFLINCLNYFLEMVFFAPLNFSQVYLVLIKT